MGTASFIWFIIAAILSVVGGFVLYFMFLKPSNNGKFEKFVGWLYDFLSFRKMMLESILKITYLILALFISLASLGMNNIPMAIFTIIFGNISLRIFYEFLLVQLIICRNTNEINSRMAQKDNIEKKEEIEK